MLDHIAEILQLQVKSIMQGRIQSYSDVKRINEFADFDKLFLYVSHKG